MNDEDDEEDLNPELHDYIYRGETDATTTDAYQEHLSSSRSDDGVEAAPANRYSLTKGMSFLSYLLTNPRGSFNIDHRSKSSAALEGQVSPNSSEPSSRVINDDGNASKSSSLPKANELTDEELERELDTWDFSAEGKDNISETGRLSPVFEEDIRADASSSDEEAPVELSPNRDSIKGKSPLIFKVRSSSGDIKSISHAATYPLDDHGGDENTIIVLEPKISPKSSDGMHDIRATSLRLEPNVLDQTLKGWRSPNLTPNASTRTPFATLSRQSSSRNRSVSLTAEDIFLESELDLELDGWKVPVEIDHILEDMNLDNLDIEQPIVFPVKSNSRTRPSAQPNRRGTGNATKAVEFQSDEDNSFYRESSEDSIPIGDIVGRARLSSASTSSNVSTNDLREGLDEESKSAFERSHPAIDSPSTDIKFSTFSPFIRKPSLIFQRSADDLSDGIRTPTREETVEDSMSTKRELIDSIRRGDAYHVRLMLLNGRVSAEDLIPEEASKTILWCVQNLEDLDHAEDTLRLLIESFNGDVNYRSIKSETGAPPLMHCIHRPDIGRFLMSKGADIFLKDRSGTNALAASITKNQTWLVEEFADSEQEASLFNDPDETKLREYVAWLVFAGYGTKLAKHISNGDVTISAAQATILFSQCSENFSNMKEPVETYELLERLMASAL